MKGEARLRRQKPKHQTSRRAPMPDSFLKSSLCRLCGCGSNCVESNVVLFRESILGSSTVVQSRHQSCQQKSERDCLFETEAFLQIRFFPTLHTGFCIFVGGKPVHLLFSLKHRQLQLVRPPTTTTIPPKPGRTSPLEHPTTKGKTDRCGTDTLPSILPNAPLPKV